MRTQYRIWGSQKLCSANSSSHECLHTSLALPKARDNSLAVPKAAHNVQIQDKGPASVRSYAEPRHIASAVAGNVQVMGQPLVGCCSWLIELRPSQAPLQWQCTRLHPLSGCNWRLSECRPPRGTMRL